MKGFSNCCDALLVNGICQDCGEPASANLYDCEICEDTGEVSAMETVYPNEPYQAPTGTQICECKIVEEDDTRDE